MKRFTLATIVVGLIVNLSEFLRNEVVLKHHWIEKYESLGLLFPASPLNALLWILWGFIFAVCVVSVSDKYSFLGAIALCWVMGFMLMWVVTVNLSVLPMSILPLALPWSIAETALAVFAARKLSRSERNSN